MGGAFNIKMHMKGYYDDNVYFNNPPDYIPNLKDDNIHNIKIVFGVGQNDFCLPDNQAMSEILTEKNIDHWLDIRPNKDHDWPVWREMFPEYVNQIVG
jgi:esterase/lipase superfamily enzyme